MVSNFFFFHDILKYTYTIHLPLREVILNSGIYWILKKTLRHVFLFNFYFSRARWAVMIIAALSLGERLFFKVLFNCSDDLVQIQYNYDICRNCCDRQSGNYFLVAYRCCQKTTHNFMYFLSNLRTFCVISFTDAVNLLDFI